MFVSLCLLPISHPYTCLSSKPAWVLQEVFSTFHELVAQASVVRIPLMIAEAVPIFSSFSSSLRLRCSPLRTSGTTRGSVRLTSDRREVHRRMPFSLTLACLPIQGRKLSKEVLMVIGTRKSPCWCSLERNVWLLFVCLPLFPWQPPLSPTISKEHVLEGVSF